MPISDSIESAVLSQRVAAEINRLTEQQTEAMQKATVICMTGDETKEYNERRSRIAELVEQLAMITGHGAL
jgi:hypothetical protein